MCWHQRHPLSLRKPPRQCTPEKKTHKGYRLGAQQEGGCDLGTATWYPARCAQGDGEGTSGNGEKFPFSSSLLGFLAKLLSVRGFAAVWQAHMGNEGDDKSLKGMISHGAR